MFTILKKSQDAVVNADDLETLQKELEAALVGVVSKKWELEHELLALNTSSPDNGGTSTTLAPPSLLATPSGAGKVKHPIKPSQIEPPENATDGFKGSLFNNNSSGNNNGPSGSASGTNSTEDSDGSSDGSSLISSVTGSTIILANQPEGSQATNSTSTLIAGTKRSHKGKDDRPSKRFRQNSSANTSNSNFTKRPPHSKHRSKIVPSKFRDASVESRPHKKQILKNEAPDKLWPFVEQFCATPTEEQVEQLGEMIKSMENDKEYFRVPALGKRDASSKDSPSKSSDTSSKSQKKNKSRSNDEESGLGALSQRLVSTFIEETDDSETQGSKNGEGQGSKKKGSKAKNSKGIDMNSAKNLEKTIRQELEEHDILEQNDDIPYTSEEDEILRELVASQHELLSIQRQNKESMRILLKRAKKHMELEREREKLREANEEVVSAYHRLIQARQRKRNPTKKEKDAAWIALKIQEAIFKRCDDLYMSGIKDGGI